jgi:hypothetical protein
MMLAHDDSAYHEAVSTLLDPFSYERAIHLIDPPGARCLEVGAGPLASYLANLVKPEGHVVVLDPRPMPIAAHPNLSVVHHDLTIDPVPGRFNFIHVRLTLAHLAARHQILARLVDALTPGGCVLVEDWDTTTNVVLHAPNPQAVRRYSRIHRALNQIAATDGSDPTWARRIHATLLNHGLTGVETTIHASDWSADGPGGQLLHAAVARYRNELLEAGLGQQTLVEVHELLDDPRFVLAGHPLYSTSGRSIR